jgi:hypothetical protein
VIDLGQPALHAEGVTLFTDHAHPGVHHYLSDRPRLRLALDGTPELSLLKYQLDPELHELMGAGLLSLTVDLSVEEDRLERLRRRLAARAGTSAVTLGPVAADAGTCELILIDRSSADDSSPPAGGEGAGEPPAVGFGLVERILGAAAPELFGAKAATFAAVLSAEGVAMVERALRQGGLPAGVVYALQVTGVRPALRASISARWQDVYHFYENRLHGGKLLLATDIGPTMEELVQNEAIRISVDDLVPTGERDGVYQRALDEAQRYVLQELFKPSLGQAPPPEDETAEGLATIGQAIKDLAGFFSLTYSLREVDRAELKTFTYQLAVARAERLTLSPQGTFSVLLGPEGTSSRLDRLITTVPAGPPAQMVFDVGVLTALDAEDIDHLEVFLEYGGTEQTLVLDAATPRRQVTLWYRAGAGLEVSYRYEVQFGLETAGLGELLASPRRTTANRVVRLDPRELFQRLEVRAVTQGVPFDRYPRVLVDVAAHDPVGGWSAAETLELDATHLEATFPVRAGVDARVQFERRLRYVEADGGELTAGWEEAEPGVMVVGDPLPEIVDLQVLGSARFGTAVRRLIVELRPVDRPELVATRVLTAEQPSATWSWSAADGAGRAYDYRVTVHTTLNEVREGRWLPGPPGGTLVVGEGIARLRKVKLVLVGKSLQDLDLLALKVRFSFEDREAGLFAEDEFLVEDARAPVEWAYPVADPDRQAYTCQLTAIQADGSSRDLATVTSSDLLLVRPLS